MHSKTFRQRGFILLLSLMMSISTFAFNFAGKTFKGSRSENGIKLTMTIRFMANNKATATMSATGSKTRTDNHCHWEVSGDFINMYDSTGDCAFLRIDWGEDYGEEWDTPELDFLDDSGYTIVTLKYAPGSSSSSKKKRK